MSRRLSLRMLLVVAALLAFAAKTVYAPDRPLATLTDRWAPPPSRFIPVLNVLVHIREEGSRRDTLPLVLLHGTSASLHTWDGWAKDLARDRRVIRFDLPAFGLTGPFPDDDYSPRRYVRFLTALLDSLQLPRAILVGNSFGGELAWSTAVLAPSRVAGLVLVDAAGYPRAPTSEPIGFRLARIPVLNKLLTVVLPRSIVASSLRSSYGDTTRVTDSLITRYYELTLRAGNRAALPKRMAASRDDSLMTLIPTVKVPTLILWGLRDRLILPANGERFHREIAGSRLVTFDDLGHVPMEEDPSRTVAAARSFLDERFPVTPAPAPPPAPVKP